MSEKTNKLQLVTGSKNRLNAYLVKKQWELSVGESRLVSDESRHCLLVSGTQAVVSAVPVFQAEQLLSHQIPALTGFPEVGRAQTGHVQLLPTNPLHLLVDHSHLLIKDSSANQEVGR